MGGIANICNFPIEYGLAKVIYLYFFGLAKIQTQLD